jgi:hypothetical protein
VVGKYKKSPIFAMVNISQPNLTSLKNIALIFFLMLGSEAFAQFAIVVDKDSFVNVRSGPGKDSAIVDSLKNGDVIYMFEGENNWMIVDYELNTNGFKSFKSGYIHRSRVKLVESFTEIPGAKLNDSLLVFQWDTCRLQITEKSFKSKKHHLTYLQLEGGDYIVNKIDGKEFWGTDGDIPKSQYGKCQLKLGKQMLNLPTQTLYNPNLYLTRLYIDRSSITLYLSAFNSDGAGGYVVLWVIKNGQFKQQFVDYGF